MFISKERLERIENSLRTREDDTIWLKKQKNKLSEKIEQFESLAKILGYEYVCEAMKEPSDELRAMFLVGGVSPGEQKAVLKWSWKKIISDKK